MLILNSYVLPTHCGLKSISSHTHRSHARHRVNAAEYHVMSQWPTRLQSPLWPMYRLARSPSPPNTPRTDTNAPRPKKIVRQ